MREKTFEEDDDPETIWNVNNFCGLKFCWGCVIMEKNSWKKCDNQNKEFVRCETLQNFCNFCRACNVCRTFAKVLQNVCRTFAEPLHFLQNFCKFCRTFAELLQRLQNFCNFWKFAELFQNLYNFWRTFVLFAKFAELLQIFCRFFVELLQYLQNFWNFCRTFGTLGNLGISRTLVR